ncbi:MAG TPA: Rieske (2Fe-2S) protein [Bryobacteraceae bacterium]|jgi:menaquinol-cytochrome c reductase iron-sulfur subunit|nr:Rieske (2Fe-2S) protein [Bryobacteraceae bacterium]
MTNPTAEHNGTEVYSTTRRAFHLTIIYMLGAIMTLAMAIPTVIYLLVPPRVRKRSGWIDAGDISQLKPGEPIELSFQQNSIDGWKVESVKKTAWVVKEADNQVVAFGPQCTHLACAYHWEAAADKFICPCHGSEFSLEGKVLAGPAPRPLDRYVTKIENNRLQLGELKQSQA